MWIACTGVYTQYTYFRISQPKPLLVHLLLRNLRTDKTQMYHWKLADVFFILEKHKIYIVCDWVLIMCQYAFLSIFLLSNSRSGCNKFVQFSNSFQMDGDEIKNWINFRHWLMANKVLYLGILNYYILAHPWIAILRVKINVSEWRTPNITIIWVVR